VLASRDHFGNRPIAVRPPALTGANRLLDITRMALSPDDSLRGHFHGTTACLSALYAAGRYEDLIGVLETESFWRAPRGKRP